MRVESDNLIIRSAVIEDAEQLTAWWNDGAVMAHAGFPNGLGINIEKTSQLIAQNKINRSQRCILEVDGLRIGELSYTVAASTAEVGIKLCDTNWQGRGVGTRLLSLLIGYLFCGEGIGQDLPIQKIILDTNLDNLRAQYVYEKLGFRKLRINENSWQDQFGEWQSSVDYELTKGEFLTR